LKPQDKARELFEAFFLNQYTNFRSERMAWKSVEIVADVVLYEIDHELQGFLHADRVHYWEQIKKIARDSQS
jgi:hypothetical protein